MAPRVLNEGWLAAYMRYTADQEAPELYHFWTGLSVLAGAIRRNMWVDRVDYKIFPNLYVFLVGGTAIGKSTALMTGFRLLRQVENVHTFHGRISNEALFDEMNRTVKTDDGIVKDGTIFLFADELKSFLGEREYARELMTTLTDLYAGQDDIPFRHRTISRGASSPTLTNYLINFLAGTTQSWLGEIMRPSMFEGGAIGRIIFVNQTAGRGVSEVDPEDRRAEIEDLRFKLGHDLNVIAKMQGQFRITREARDYWKEWRKTIPKGGDARLLGYLGRKHDTVLKLAMIYSVSANDKMTIEIPHIRGAIQTLDCVEPLMLDAFSHIGTNESSIAAQIINLLDRLGGKAPKYIIMRQMGHLVRDAKAFHSILETMQMQGKISLLRAGSNVWISLITEQRLSVSNSDRDQDLPFEEPLVTRIEE